jgi:hypothetical protein
MGWLLSEVNRGGKLPPPGKFSPPSVQRVPGSAGIRKQGNPF